MYVSCVDFVFFPNPDSGQMNVIWWVLIVLHLNQELKVDLYNQS